MAILFGGDFRTVCAILAEEHFCKFQKEILFIDISIFSTGGIFFSFAWNHLFVWFDSLHPNPAFFFSHAEISLPGLNQY